jgi:hypothetical protein
MKNYGFTGTRHGMTIDQHRVLVVIMLSCYIQIETLNEEFKWHQGMCVGADKQSSDLARIFGFKIKGHPPNNNKFVAPFHNLDEVAPPKDYLDRNHDIVNESDHLIAMPYTHTEVLRSGTWATIRYAVGKEVGVSIIYPDGTTEER